MQRLILYAKDVQAFTGKSEKASRALIRKIRNFYNRPGTQTVTVNEFSEYTGISEKLLLDFLR